ncbi:MAG: hypothetical protein ACFCVK_02740 [Acidimicrobiales bacterium]
MSASDGSQTDTTVLQRHLLGDLERYVKLTKPASLRAFQGDALGGVAGELARGVGPLIEDAVERIADRRYRRAAWLLLVDPEHRTSNLTTRSSLAAAEFGLAPDTFRKRTDGASPRTEVLDEVASELAQLATAPTPESDPSSAVAPSAVAPSVVAPAARPVAPATDPGRTVNAAGPLGFRRRRLVAVAVALLVGVVVGSLTRFVGPDADGSEAAGEQDGAVAGPATGPGGGEELMGEVDVSLHCETTNGAGWVAAPDPASSSGWLCRRGAGGPTVAADIAAACHEQYGDAASARVGDGPSTWRCVMVAEPSAADGDCAVAAGSYDPSLSGEYAPYAASFRRRFDESAAATTACPLTVMHRWATGILQELGTDGVSTGALVATEPDAVLLLDGSAWQAFNRIKGIYGEFVGYPENEPERRGDVVVVALSAGGALVAERLDGPFYWLPPVIFPYWKGRGGPTGCLGLAISDPYASGDSFKQDFEHGRLVLDPLAGSFGPEGDTCP